MDCPLLTICGHWSLCSLMWYKCSVFSAWSLLQCFDTVTWVKGRTFISKNLYHFPQMKTSEWPVKPLSLRKHLEVLVALMYTAVHMSVPVLWVLSYLLTWDDLRQHPQLSKTCTHLSPLLVCCYFCQYWLHGSPDYLPILLSIFFFTF